MAGKPYQSKLIPYEDYIMQARRNGVIYMEILKTLREKESIECALSTLYSFVKTRSRKDGFGKMLPRNKTSKKEDFLQKKSESKKDSFLHKKKSRFVNKPVKKNMTEEEIKRAKEWDKLGEIVNDLFHPDRKQIKKGEENEN